MLSERELHQRFSAWLNARWIPFLHSRTDRKTTTACGDPDYLLALHGRCLFIEIKVGANKLSPAQEARIDYLRKAGNRVEVCHSLEECYAAAESLCANPQTPARNPFTGHLDAIAGESCKVTSTTYTTEIPSTNERLAALRVNEGEE